MTYPCKQVLNIASVATELLIIKQAPSFCLFYYETTISMSLTSVSPMLHQWGHSAQIEGHYPHIGQQGITFSIILFSDQETVIGQNKPSCKETTGNLSIKKKPTASLQL
jgi:hypothetical protein